jgi:hypothetical protein
MLLRTLLLGCALLAFVPRTVWSQTATPNLPPRPRSADGAHGEHGPHTHPGNAAAALRLAAAYQVRFHAEHGRYASTTAELGFPEHAGVTVRMVAKGGQGYSAVATSRAEECAYYEGSVQVPRRYATAPTTVQCRARR